MRSSAAQIAANRKNAKKSTGPRTVAGKRASALNATRHAVLSVSPVLADVERIEDWEAHRKATLASLIPAGYLETAFAERVASVLWRLGRVTRYETENTTSELEMAEADVAKCLRSEGAFSSYGRLGSKLIGETRTQLQEELEILTDNVRAFACLREYGVGDPFPPALADAVLFAVAGLVDVDLEDLLLPFSPPEALELGLDGWTGWTKNLVLEAVTVVVSASEEQDAAVPELLREAESNAEVSVLVAARALQETEAQLRRSVRSRLLLPDPALERVARYETHLERSLLRALHEIQRLQAARDGVGGAPLALDVDVSAGPRTRRPRKTAK